MAQRPWYRLHWATWLSTMFLTCVLIWSQFVECTFTVRHPPPIRSGVVLHGHGFPQCWHGYSSAQSWRTGVPRPIPIRIISANFIYIAVTVAAAAFVVERLQRREWQFRLSSLFVLTAVIAALLVTIRLQTSINWAMFQRSCDYVIHLGWLFPTYCRHPMLFAFACTVYTAGWLASRGAAWGLRLVWRRPAEPEAPA